MPAKAKLTTRQESTTQVSSDNFAKGSELTYAEADSNFINLRDQTIAISDGATTTDIQAGETITFSGASVSGNTVSITGGGGGSVGDLSIIGSTISSPSNADLTLTTNGSGQIVLGQHTSVGVLTFATDGVISTPATGSANTLTITTQGNGNIDLVAETITISSSENVNMETFHIRGNEIRTSQSNADIELIPNGSGSILLKSDTTAIGDGSGSEAALLTTLNDVPLHIGPNTSQANLTATNGLTSNSDGYIRINNNGLITVRAAGDDYIYLEGETVSFGRPGVGETSAAGKISSLGRENFTITANNNINGWEPRILLTAPGPTSSASHKAESKITMDAGDSGSGSLDMTMINIFMSNLPTSDPTTAGQLWNDSGTLKISAG